MFSTKLDYIVKVPSFANKSILKQFTWQSLVFYSKLRYRSLNDTPAGFYMNYSSTYLQKQYGKNYRYHLDSLLERNWIEENSSYKNAKDGYSKSYRISDQNYPYKHKNYAVLVQKRIWNKLVKNKEEEFEGDSPYISLIKTRHDKLRIDHARTLKERKLKTQLDQKLSKIRIADNGRLYSTIINSDKEARNNVIFGDRGKMVNVDISSAMFQILNKDIKDEKLNKYIIDGLRDTLKKKLNLKGSDSKIQKSFMSAISKTPVSGNAEIIRSFLRKQFPSIMELVDKYNLFDSVQAVTQRLESSMIKGFIMSKMNLEMIPAHDGIFCGEEDVRIVQAELENFLQMRGMIGHTKVKPDDKKYQKLTIVDILNRL
jgi:hypothetical protein